MKGGIGMIVSLKVVLAYFVGLLLLYILARILVVPIKIVVNLIFNAVVGVLALILVNYIGSLFGIQPIGINVVTALVVGFFGVPGVILLLVLRYIL